MSLEKQIDITHSHEPPQEKLTFKKFMDRIEEILGLEPNSTDMYVEPRSEVLCRLLSETSRENNELHRLREELESRLSLPPEYASKKIKDKVNDLLMAHSAEQDDLEEYQTNVATYPELAMRAVGEFLGIGIDRLDPLTIQRLESTFREYGVNEV
jgi:hypothetical protein